jgi:3-oxoacyl-[acyl-carrier protein] reductase
MDLGLTGARALVCGGSAGLGAAVAAELVAEGARVAIAARPGPHLDERAQRLPAVAVPVDLATETGPRTAVASAVEALGGLDCLLVNSGGPPLGRFGDLTEAEWQRAIDGTLWSALRLVREALPHLGAGRAPAIAVILSSSVRMPVDGITTSNVLRPGLAGLVKSLAAEIAPIRINGIAPGRIATERVAQLDAATAARTGRSVEEVRAAVVAQIPLGRYGEPAEVGRLAAFLLSPAASYLTGVIVPIDGGMIRSLP